VTVSVRSATPADVEGLSHVLARAFREDPLHRWIFPTDRAWMRSSHKAFAVSLRGEIGHGTVFTDRELRGAAICRDPGLGPPSIREQVGLAASTLALLGTRSPIVFRGFRRLMALHPQERHWYLSVLGTDPEHQRKGIGEALLRAILDRCDDTGHAAYLEASRSENVPYYERRGFEVVGELRLPSGPPVWRMLYRPGGTPTEAAP